MAPGESSIRLRPIEFADWASIHEWASTEEACRYQPWGPNTVHDTQTFVTDAIAAWDGANRTDMCGPPSRRELASSDLGSCTSVGAAGSTMRGCAGRKSLRRRRSRPGANADSGGNASSPMLGMDRPGHGRRRGYTWAPAGVPDHETG
jgi:hypothetical protein